MSYHEAASAVVIQEADGSEVSVQPGDRIRVNYVSTIIVNLNDWNNANISQSHALNDDTCFPEPESVNPRRPVGSYLQISGARSFLGSEITHVALAEMFRALFKHKNVARAPGPQGELKRVVHKDGTVSFLREDWGSLSPFPVTLKVTWDE